MTCTKVWTARSVLINFNHGMMKIVFVKIRVFFKIIQ